MIKGQARRELNHILRDQRVYPATLYLGHPGCAEDPHAPERY